MDSVLLNDFDREEPPLEHRFKRCLKAKSVHPNRRDGLPVSLMDETGISIFILKHVLSIEPHKMQGSPNPDMYDTRRRTKPCSLTTDKNVGKLAIKWPRQPESVRTRDTLHVNPCLIMKQATRNQKALVR